jgi:hypothetical protein
MTNDPVNPDLRRGKLERLPALRRWRKRRRKAADANLRLWCPTQCASSGPSVMPLRVISDPDRQVYCEA